jgi:leucine dehydrogenase
MWNAPPEELVALLEHEGLRRGYLVTLPGEDRMIPSHPVLAPLAQAISADARDYHGHEGVFFELGEATGGLLTAFLHRTMRGQGAGGVRLARYETVEALVRDGLRLSRGMGHKNALAGLWWGGGKGVIARDPGRDDTDRRRRDALYRDYGRFVSGLRGAYVTAEDAGTEPADMVAVHSTTRFTTCVPEDLGGSGNPSRLTAAGVAVAMEAALRYLGRGDLSGKTVAIQGLGHVGRFLVGELTARGARRIIGADVRPEHVGRARREHPDSPLEARIVAPDDTAILAEEADIVSPNALGACLNRRTIAELRAPIVCGGANNQLEDPEADSRRLHDRGVLYVPDFLANRMGIVNCSNEQYGRLESDPAILAHLDHRAPHGIYQRSLEIFARARASGRPTALEAEALAEELSLQPHPLWPHRAQAIILELVRSGWAD